MASQTDADAARQLAERRLIGVLQRYHRHAPMAEGMRTDALLAALRDPGGRPPGHRGAAPLALDDTELLELIDLLVERGLVERSRRRLRLAGHRRELQGAARASADALLAALRATGARPPRVDGVARRLGVAPWVVEALRQTGELVGVAPGIEYPRDVLDALLDRLAETGIRSVASARDELDTSRRHAAALLEALQARA
ncbi:MAG TPA: hypothetical protein VFM74_05535 [Candidatus Limnocylindria bacterium]|nr:hypothetical protein [Candidatus Limnocylindria bacterium]